MTLQFKFSFLDSSPMKFLQFCEFGNKCSCTNRLKSLRIHTQRFTSFTVFDSFNVNNAPIRYAINCGAVYNSYCFYWMGPG